MLSQSQVVGRSAGRCSSLRRRLSLESSHCPGSTIAEAQVVRVPVKTPTPIARTAGIKFRLISEGSSLREACNWEGVVEREAWDSEMLREFGPLVISD